MQQRADGRILVGIIFLLAAAPAAASSARLLGPGGFCVGVAGKVVPGAAVVLETCDGGTGQVWEMPPRGSHGAIRLGGLCLGGSPASLRDCEAAGDFGSWHHASDGWLITGAYGPVATSGYCLDASGSLEVAACSGAASQRFFAEGQDAWTPRLASGPSPFLPVETSFPAIRYGSSSFAHLRSENYGRTYEPFRAGAASDVFAVSPFDPRRLWLISRGTLEISRDGGRSWTPVAQLPAAIGGGAPRIAPSRIDENRVYVYGLGLLWASHDGGQTFAERGALPLPRTSETQLIDLGGGGLLFLRVDHCLVACDPQNVHLWRSGDEGAGWQPVLSRESAVTAAWLVADPHHPDEIYLTLRPSAEATDSLVRSTDGGRTFADAGRLPSRDGRLFFDRDESGRRYLFQQEALWRSQGGGWQALASPLAGLGVSDSRMAEFGSGFLRISAVSVGPDGARAVYFDSFDAGESFVRLDPVGYGATGIDPLPVAFTGRPGVFYHLDGATLQRTEDGGATWQDGARLWGAKDLAADPRDPARVFALLPSGLELSEDAGASFAPVAGPAAAATALAVFAAGGRTVVVAAGLPSFYVSRDGGRSWSPLPSPRPAERFEKLVANELVIFAVSENDELFRSHDDGQTWERLNVAEKSLVFGSGLLAYVRSHESTLRVSDDGGATFVDRHPPDQLGEGAGLHIDARNNIYVAGATTVLRSSDRGRTWQSLGHDLIPADAPRYAVAADPFAEGKLYHGGALGLHLGRFSAAPPLDLGARFEARVTWRDYLGQSGKGVAQALTRDSGLFWLFTAGRAEVSVKVLDGRAINGKFWVFLASMTDVELDLEVEDRITGEIWSYHNPLGRFLSFGDIEAFPREGSDPAVAAPSPVGGLLLGTTEQVVIAGRFEVEVDWNAAGQSGNGQGRRLNSESAAFYFFDPANVELVVNVLDGRPINGKFWVYFGSMSDVAYTVRIKDRVSGQVKTYSNPAGSFASVGDSEAFE